VCQWVSLHRCTGFCLHASGLQRSGERECIPAVLRERLRDLRECARESCITTVETTEAAVVLAVATVTALDGVAGDR